MPQRTPRWYQAEAIKFINQCQGRCGVFADLGTGKTLIAIHAAQTPALVICRRDDFETWRRELIAEGVPEEKIAFIDSNDFSIQPARWVIATYGTFINRLRGGRVTYSRVADFVRSRPFKTVICDESHSIKNSKSKRSKAVYKCTRHIPRRLALTATPTPNSPEDAFQQFLFLDDGQSFGKSWWSFMNSYFLRAGPMWVIKRGSKAIIEKKMQRRAFFIDQKIALKLPPIRTLIKSCQLSKPQSLMYRKILTEWEYEIKAGEVIEINYVIQQVAKLRQIAGGFMYHDDEVTRFPCPKLALLLDVLEQLSKPKVVIWCAFTAEIIRILELLGDAAVGFYGADAQKKLSARRAFASNPKVKYFVGQVDSGVGMNDLVIADTAVYYSNSYRLISRVQSEGRLRRFGAEAHKRILFIDLVSEGTLDSELIDVLKEKRDFMQMILESIDLLNRHVFKGRLSQ